MGKDNTQRIAEKIYEITHADLAKRKLWKEQGIDPFAKRWDLTNDTYMEESDDCMVWYIWQRDPDQNSPYCKVVPFPNIYTKAEITAILKAQMWIYI